MFDSVIIPIDGSPRDGLAMAVADAVALRAGTSIELFKVAHPAEAYEAKAQLDEAAERLHAPVIRREIFGPSDVASAVAGEQHDHPRSLVVMATHARTGARELVLGGHAGDVVRRALRPLLLVGPHAEPPADLGSVLVCLDGSKEAERILTPAATWAQRMGGRLVLATVVAPGGVGTAEESGQLERAAATVDDRVPVEWDVLHGRDVASTLVDRARAVQASIIALTTHGSTAARDRLLGSVAMRIAHDARVPVLVQRAWR